MLRDEASNALRKGRRLQLSYDGFVRVVEVHSIGRSRDGHTLMRVFQVRGGSQSRERSGWKLLRLDGIATAAILDERSEAPRAGYNPDDKAMAHTYCRIESPASGAAIRAVQ